MHEFLKSNWGDLYSSLPRWHRKAYLALLLSFSWYAFQGRLRHIIIDHGNPAGVTDFHKLRLSWSFFGRFRSRCFGWLMERQIPQPLRRSILSSFANLLRIDIKEARYPLEAYVSCANLFARTLADGMRPIVGKDDVDALCMPCDGKIMNIATIDFNQEYLTPFGSAAAAAAVSNPNNAKVGPVKGATFRLESFLGLDPRFLKGPVRSSSECSASTATSPTEQSGDAPYEDMVDCDRKITESVSPARKLYYTVIYLRPCDYHHFHAPCEMVLQMRRHMPGFTFPVFKAYAQRMNSLFALNERIVYAGRWKYGEMFYSAVAAYNVANIRLKFEPDFRSNVYRTELYAIKRVMESLSYQHTLFDNLALRPTKRTFSSEGSRPRLPGDASSDAAAVPGKSAAPRAEEDESKTPFLGVWVEKGEELGEFRLGSTVVLIFEAPPSFQWDVEIGQVLKMGEPLGRVVQAPAA